MKAPLRITHRPFLPVAAAMILSASSAPAAVDFWTGASGSDLNWTTPGNWSPGAPGAADDVRFIDTGTAADMVTVNNIVAVDHLVQSLWYGQTNGIHNTRIDPGITLTVSNAGAVALLLAGTETNQTSTFQQNNTISGDGGTLVLGSTNVGSSVTIRQAHTIAGAHWANLDMSGLDRFVASVGRVLIANQGSIIRPGGIWVLARTNTITAFGATAPVINLGDGNSNGGTATVQLGQTNGIVADTITVARQKSNSILQFQPALTNGSNPTLHLRGRTATRVTNLSAGDNSAQSASGAQTTGNINLGGGTVDAQVDSIFLGRGQNGAGTGGANGTLSFDGGVIDVNTVEAGYLTAATAVGSVQGTVNVNGTATIRIHTALRLARYLAGATGTATGTLNINGGTGQVYGVISDGGGNSTINVYSGVLDLQPEGDAAPGTVAAKTITIGVSGSGTITNALSISAGSLTLGADGAIGGPTIIDLGPAGTFDGSALAAGFVLNPAQTLRGAGTVNGTFTLGPGATLSPGGDAAAGSLLFTGAVTLQDGNLKYDLSPEPTTVGGSNDLMTVQGSLTLSGTNQVMLNPTSAVFGNGTYRLMEYSSSLSGDASNLRVFGPVASSRHTFTFDTGVAGQVNLTIGGTGPTNLTWRGDGLSNTWDLIGAANWSSGGGAESYYNLDTVLFDDGGSNSPSVMLVGTLYPASITVSNDTKDYTFDGPGAIDGPTGLRKLGAGSLTISGTGPHSFTGPISVDGGSLSVNRADDLTVTNAISGAGTLIQSGTNVVTLAPPVAAFDGPIFVNAGTLRAGSTAALGTVAGATTVAPGATLDVNDVNLGVEPVTVSGTGVNGAGAIVDLTAGSAYNTPNLAYVTMAGDTTFGGTGRWDLRSNPATGNNAALGTGGNAYRLTKVGTNQVAIVGVVVDPALGDIDVRSGTLGFETATTSIGNPASTMTIFTNATFRLYNVTAVLSKIVVMQEGAIFRNDSGACAFAGPITLQGSNVFNIGGTSLALSGRLSGAGQMNKIGASPLILTATDNDWSGGTTIAAGTLQIGDGGANGSLPDQPITDNGTLNYNSSLTMTFNQAISGSGGVQVNGSGTLILTAANTYSNQTFINSFSGGALRITHGSALGDPVGNTRINGNTNANGRLELAGGIVVAEPFLLDCRQYTTINVPHIVNVADDNTLAGTISGGTGGSDWNIQSDSGTLTVAGHFLNTAVSATRNLKLSGAGNGEWSGIISNSAGNLSLTAVVKNDAGTWILSGENAYTGPTTVNAGALVVNGSIAGGSVAVNDGATLAGGGMITAPVTVNAGGTLSPGGSIGTITVVGTLSLGGTNMMEVSKAGGAITCDRILGVSSLSYGGVLKLVLSGDALAAGDSFALYTAGLRTGSFASIDPATPGPDLVWDTTSLNSDGILKVAAASTTPPVISSASMSDGRNLVVSGTGGTAGSTYYMLTSTNMLTPITNWWPVATNVFGPDGSFNLTIPLVPGALQQYYMPAR